MNIFDFISPIDYRYIPKDEELAIKAKEYASLNIFSKLRKAVPEIIIPRLNSFEIQILNIATENKEKQIPKRINGKHDGKISLEEIFTSYFRRLKSRSQNIGKLNLNFEDVEEAVQNDIISDLVYFSISAFSVEANIANDIRHLFRSEIAEFSHKKYPIERVGSSTMVHKRNPVEYEQIVSLWKEYLPRVTSMILSQVTEHQGDSTNEELPYYAFELLCGLSYATKSLENSLKNLKVNI